MLTLQSTSSMIHSDTAHAVFRAGREEFTLSMKELKRHVRKPATICHTPKARCYLLVSAPAKSAPYMSLPACLDFICHATPLQCFYSCGH